MANLIERLGQWFNGPPPPLARSADPTSELESTIKAMVLEHKRASEESHRLNVQRSQQEAIEKQAKILEFRQKCLTISRDSDIINLLEQAKRGLKPVYPSVAVYQEWRNPDGYLGYNMRYLVTMTWGSMNDTHPVSPGTNSSHSYIRFECDGYHNQLSLRPAKPLQYNHNASEEARTTRFFTPEEWRDTQIMTRAIIEAVKNPVSVSYIPRDRSE